MACDENDNAANAANAGRKEIQLKAKRRTPNDGRRRQMVIRLAPDPFSSFCGSWLSFCSFSSRASRLLQEATTVARRDPLLAPRNSEKKRRVVSRLKLRFGRLLLWSMT